MMIEMVSGSFFAIVVVGGGLMVWFDGLAGARF
jgi:hypothetical protein